MQMSQNDARNIYEACPLCQSSEIRADGSADCTEHNCYNPSLPPAIYWMRCAKCGHGFTNGYFKENALELLFTKTDPVQQVGYDMMNQRVVSAQIVAKVTPYQQSGDWLDIGFGNGSLLFTATPTVRHSHYSLCESDFSFGI